MAGPSRDGICYRCQAPRPACVTRVRGASSGEGYSSPVVSGRDGLVTGAMIRKKSYGRQTLPPANDLGAKYADF